MAKKPTASSPKRAPKKGKTPKVAAAPVEPAAEATSTEVASEDVPVIERDDINEQIAEITETAAAVEASYDKLTSGWVGAVQINPPVDPPMYRAFHLKYSRPEATGTPLEIEEKFYNELASAKRYDAANAIEHHSSGGFYLWTAGQDGIFEWQNVHEQTFEVAARLSEELLHYELEIARLRSAQSPAVNGNGEKQCKPRQPRQPKPSVPVSTIWKSGDAVNAQTPFGLKRLSLLYWMGASGFTADQGKTVFDHFKIEYLKPASMIGGIRDGKRGSARVPILPAEIVSVLEPFKK